MLSACQVINHMFFLQVQSSPLSGRPPKQPCTGGSRSSLTYGLSESYSQSWSPKEECHTQVRAGPGSNGPPIGCCLSTIWGHFSVCLLSPILSFLLCTSLKNTNRYLAMGKQNWEPPWTSCRQAATMHCMPGVMWTAASMRFQSTPVHGISPLSVGVCIVAPGAEMWLAETQPKSSLQTLPGKRCAFWLHRSIDPWSEPGGKMPGPVLSAGPSSRWP